MTSRIGQFRDRVNIQRNRAAAHDPEEDFTGTAFLQDWPCRIISTGGDETFRGRQLEAHVDYVLEGWYTAGIKPTMRCVVTSGIPMGAALNIDVVKHIPQTDGKPAQTWLYCTELVSV